MTNQPVRGRAFMSIAPEDRRRFGAWFAKQVENNGGRAAVAEVSGLDPDNISKWCGGRALPSQKSIVALIETGVIQYATIKDLIAHEPWQEFKPLPVKKRPAPNRKPKEIDIPEPQEFVTGTPVEAPEPDLIRAIISHPKLDHKQRVQLTALVTLVLSGVDIEVAIQNRV